MNSPLSLVTGGTSSPLNVAISTEGGGIQLSVNGSEPIDFQQILSGQQNTAAVLDLLRSKLTPEQFSQFQELLEGGKPLPLAAIFSQLLNQAGSDETILPSDGGTDVSPQDEGDLQLLLAESLTQLLRWKQSQQSEKADDSDGSGPVSLPLLSLQGDTPNIQQHQESPAIPVATDAGVKTPAESVALLQPVVTPTDNSSSTVVNSLAGAAVSQAPPVTNSSTAASSQLPLPAVPVPPGEPGWDRAVGERISWMVSGDIQAASIQIKPPHLGPLHIQLSIQNDQATIHFTTHHGVVKEALEAAIPRLREMLAENGGIQLVNVDVSQRESTTQGDPADAYRQGDGGGNGDGSYLGDGERTVAQPTFYYRSNGLIDDYA